MPPKKAAKKAPAAPPLDGCVITLSGTFPGRSQTAIDKEFITPLGATLSSKIASTTTHLVTTDVDYGKVTTKVKQSQAQGGIQIVGLEWLEDCLAKNTKLKEDTYTFGQPAPAAPNGKAQPTTTAANGKAAGSRKRTVVKSEVDVDEDEEEDDNNSPPKKKAKATKANGSASQPSTKPPPTTTTRIDTKTDATLDAKSKPKKAVTVESNVAKTSAVNIRIDEHCPHANHRVYVDKDGLVYDASLNQTNASNNNNKFYRVQLLVDGRGNYITWTRWGRVGERGQSATLGNGDLQGAINEFEAKFKSKTGLKWANRADNPKPSKYTFVERSYDDDSSDEEEKDTKVAVQPKKEEKVEPPESKLDPAIQKLMELIFNQQFFAATMTDLNYDVNKLPLGKLSKNTITRGYQSLKNLSLLLNDASLAQSEYGLSYVEAVEHLSNTFYSLIPHAFGRNRPPVIQTQDALKKEVDLLDSLGDMKEASNIMKSDPKADAERVNVLDQQFKALGMDEMTPLKKEDKEFTELKKYLVDTRGATHNANYEVDEIFRIERQGEKERFEKKHSGPPRDRRLLWHGSRATNFGGILSQGLRIAPPEAPVNGYMFGKGIYLADMSSKSANYCCSYNTGGTALLLLCEAELGDPMQVLTDASYSAGEDAKAKGLTSTWGQGTTGPTKWKDAGCAHPSLKGIKMPDTSKKPGPTGVNNAYLAYNEYITYDISQVRLRYLLRVRM